MKEKVPIKANNGRDSQPKKKCYPKLGLRLFLYPAAAVVIVLLATFLFLQTDMARNIVKDFIEKAAEKHLQIKLEVGRISGSLLFDFSLEDVRISEKDGPILTAKRISANYLISLLLAKVVFFNEIQFEGLVLHLVKNTDGLWNVATIGPQNKENKISKSKPISIKGIINRISILDAVINITDIQNDVPFTRQVNNLRIIAGLRLKSDSAITAQVMDFSFSLDQPDVTFKSLTGRIDYRPNRKHLNIRHIRIRSMQSDVVLNGSIDLDPAGIEFDMNTAIKTLSIPEIGQIFSIPTLNSGMLHGSIHAKGRPNRFYHESNLNLDRMSLSTKGSIELSRAEPFGMDVSATIRHLNPAALPLPGLNKIRADINSDIVIKASTLNRPERRGRLVVDVKPSHLAGYELTAGKIKATFDPKGIILKDSRLSGPLGSIDVRSAVAEIFDSARSGLLVLDASLKNLNLAGLTRRPNLNGNINLDLNAAVILPASKKNRNDPFGMSAKISADMHASKALGINIESGRLKATWNGQQVEIDTLDLLTGAGRLELSGSLAPKKRNSLLQFDVTLPKLDKLAPLITKLIPAKIPPSQRNVSLTGNLKISGLFKGWWDQPDLITTVQGTGIQYDQFFAQGFKIKGQWIGRMNDFKASGFSQANNLKINQTQLSRVELDMNLSPEKAKADIAIKHEKGLEVRAGGQVAHWLQPSKFITIDTLKLINSGMRQADKMNKEVVNRTPIQIRVAENAVTILACELISQEATLSLTGKLTPAGSLDTNLSLARLDLARISWLWQEKDTITGILSADMHLSGSLTKPIVQSHLRVINGSGYDFSLSDLGLSIDYNASQVVFKATGYRQKKRVLDVNAKADVVLSLIPFKVQPRPNGFTAAIKTRDLKLSALPIPKSQGFDFDGVLNLDATAAGDFAAPTVKGELSLKDGFLSIEGKSPLNFSFSNLDIGFRFADTKAVITAALFKQNEKYLDLSGQAGFRLSLLPFRLKPIGDDLKVTAKARNLKLSMLPIPKRPGLNYDGVISLNASATGTISHPSVTGNVSISDGFLTIADPPLSYEMLTAELDFSPTKIFIKQFLLKGDSAGTVKLSGDVTLAGLKPTAFDIRLTGENCYVPYKKAVYARSHPDLALSGTPSAPKLTGRLTITESRVNLDLLSEQGPTDIQIDSGASKKQTNINIMEKRSTGSDFIKPLAADVIVAVPKNAWLKGQGVNAEITGQINIKKAPTKPFLLVGPLDTLRGTFDLQGKLFKVTQGKIDFVGLEEPNPNLDIQAETRIKKVKIIIKISGTARQMILALDSEPSMDRADIISYLVFGQPTSALKGQQSINSQNAALNLTGRMAAKELKNILGDAFQLDVVTIESGDKDIRQSTVSIGKYIASDVFVLYRFKVGEPDQVEVTYELNRNFSIETQLGDEKTTGLDFVWDFDF